MDTDSYSSFDHCAVVSAAVSRTVFLFLIGAHQVNQTCQPVHPQTPAWRLHIAKKYHLDQGIKKSCCSSILGRCSGSCDSRNFSYPSVSKKGMSSKTSRRTGKMLGHVPSRCKLEALNQKANCNQTHEHVMKDQERSESYVSVTLLQKWCFINFTST